MYVEQKIGEEYLKWGNGDEVFITAATGSGKSYFILHTLLRRAIERGERILYLVNRRVLKMQLEEELRGDITEQVCREYKSFVNVFDFIKVETYQNIERALLGGSVFYKISELHQYSFAVYDECHYFYTDSNFNTNTELSYDCLRREFDLKIQIFISATMDKVRELIKQRKPVFLSGEAGAYNTSHYVKKKSCSRSGDKAYEYKLTQKYDYLDIEVINGIEDLNILIKSDAHGTDKWLVFTDSIELGKKLKGTLIGTDVKKQSNELDNELNKQKEYLLKKEEVVFIDADYANDADAMESVSQLTKYNFAAEKVIIATAVIDNGVSFHDKELRNVVVMADTKESFIQMLGRKRRDNQNVKLYICRRDAEHFKRRYQYIEKVLDVYTRHAGELNLMYPETWIEEQKIKWNPYTFLCHNKMPFAHFQQRLMEDVHRNEFSYQSARKFCYAVNGVLAINSFAIHKFWELKNFYKKMANAIVLDKNAFVREQMKWLDMDEESIENLIEIAEESEDIKRQKTLEQKLKEKLSIELDRKENIDLKLLIREELKYFIQKDSDCTKQDVHNVTRTQDAISQEYFNRCMELAKLPYRMKKPTQSTFLVYIPEEEN